MDRTGFYLVFVPGLTLAVVGFSFAYAAFAMTQGPFHPSTRKGLLSLTIVLVAVFAVFAIAFKMDHVVLPK